MVRRRWLLGMLLTALTLPAVARPAVPVGLYPVQAEGLTEAERGEVQAAVESALQAADRRGVLEPRSPLVLPGTCKAPITVGCVATLAKGGVVLYAKAKRRGAAINVTVLFVDATGRKTRAVAFPIDLFIQNLRPANDAIATIEAELAAGALEDPALPPPPAALARPSEPERSAPSAAASPPAPESPRPEPPASPPAEPPATHAEKATAPIDLVVRPKAEPPPARTATRAATRERPAPTRGDWRRTAGNWAAGGGGALLVAGVVVGLTGQRLGDALSDRYARRALTPDDARLFDRVERYERLANGLFLAGGVVFATGLTLQAMAPAGGVGVAVAGSF